MTNTRAFKIDQYWPSAIGFDKYFSEIEKMVSGPRESTTFPPHNIIKTGDHTYVVELAIAGFSKNDITIKIIDNILEIKGAKDESSDTAVQYLHKGIGMRAFTKAIKLSDTIEVRGAEYRDGILRVVLENVIPDAKKPREIKIQDSITTVATKELLLETD